MVYSLPVEKLIVPPITAIMCRDETHLGRTVFNGKNAPFRFDLKKHSTFPILSWNEEWVWIIAVAQSHRRAGLLDDLFDGIIDSGRMPRIVCPMSDAIRSWMDKKNLVRLKPSYPDLLVDEWGLPK